MSLGKPQIMQGIYIYIYIYIHLEVYISHLSHISLNISLNGSKWPVLKTQFCWELAKSHSYSSPMAPGPEERRQDGLETEKGLNI